MQLNSISKKQLREFGLLVGFGFPILIGLIIPAISGHPFRIWTLWIGIPLLSLGILKPYVLFFPYKGWILIGLALGWLNSRLILMLVFIFILLPIALVMKLFGYDPLRQSKRKKITFRENIEKHKVDLKRIF
tara:strand:- start:465 stop:860 length:396 start_codon:yes stop_codon:yes gene_type:complete